LHFFSSRRFHHENWYNAPMKLVVAIVQDTDANALMKALSKERLDATKLASTGGFLREGNTTLLIGVQDEQVDHVKRVLEETCRSRKRLVMPTAPVAEQPEPLLSEPVEVPVGGAVAFVLNVEDTFKV
jgi:uncharacterized protein YaaQ